jgi:hypothetical protein
MVVGRPFQKGQSGNPGGRPKIMADVREAARAHTKEAINTLVANLSDENGNVRNAAAVALLDRGYGKPPQAIVGDSDFDPVRVRVMGMTIEQIERSIHELDAEIEALRGSAGPLYLGGGTAAPTEEE